MEKIPKGFFARKVVPPVSSGQFTRIKGFILLLIFGKEILISFSLYEVSGQSSDQEGGGHAPARWRRGGSHVY